jgi:hypothetical protein
MQEIIPVTWKAQHYGTIYTYVGMSQTEFSGTTSQNDSSVRYVLFIVFEGVLPFLLQLQHWKASS